jgi:uncharacterized protein YcbK (DUF882 family)
VKQRDADSSVAERRHFLKLTAAAATCGLLLPGSAFAAALGTATRKLSFVNLHTDERLSAVYWQNGAYQPQTLNEIDYLLRDWRTGDVKKMDVKLLDALWELHQRLDSKKPFEVISGYRSPKTNAKLASASSGVAKKSLHMQGMAIDINLADKKLTKIRDAAIGMRRGGVGYYAKSGFVHVDTGRVRAW